MKKFIPTINLCVGILAFASISLNASAAIDVSELSLEELLEVEIVSSVSKMSQKVTETPSAIRVITAQDIRRYGWRTIGEALSSLPGITVATNRAYDFIGARGILLPDDYNTRYLMVIDGTPVNDALLESAFIGDSFPIDIALINRIEYVPGAGSAAYGANAMLGTINITTKSAKGRHATEAEVKVDSMRRSSLRLTTAQSLENGAAITVSATGLYQDGQDEKYADAIGLKNESNGLPTTDGIAHNLDSGHNKQLYTKLEKDGLKLSLTLSDRTNHPSSAPHGANFDDPKMTIQDRSYDLTANYTGEVADNLAMYTNLTYMGYENKTHTPRLTQPLKQPYLGIQDSKAKRWFAEGRLTSTQLQGHQIAIGIDASKETQNELLSYNVGGNGKTQYHTDEPDSRIGIYLQDQWKLTDDWQLHTGLRYDRSVFWGNHFSPRLGLTWQTTPTVTLKAIAARSFRNPNPLEARAGIDPKKSVPFGFASLTNLNLAHESVNTRELIAEWRPNNDFELSGSIYRHELKNLIGAAVTSTSNFQHQNNYGIDVTGLETAAYYKFASQWKLNASATLQHAELGDGSRAPNAAQWLAKLAVDGPVWQDKLYAALELYANGSSSQIWEGNLAQNDTLLTSNLVLTAGNLFKGLEVQLRVNNLFNRHDTTPGSDDTPVANMPVDERNVALGVRYEF